MGNSRADNSRNTAKSMDKDKSMEASNGITPAPASNNEEKEKTMDAMLKLKSCEGVV
jgi:hypothetical protein